MIFYYFYKILYKHFIKLKNLNNTLKMSRNKCIEDFIEEYENYSDIKDEARKKKYLKKIESNYTEYPNLLDWFNDIFFSKTKMIELYDCIYSYVHNEKMLYDNILKSYEYDTKTVSIAKFILDSFDNFEEDDSTKSEQSSSDIDDFSFEQDDFIIVSNFEFIVLISNFTN